MTVPTVDLSYVFDLPRAIIWDALVDPDLVGGWLGEAIIDPRVDGRYSLGWVAVVGSAPLAGRIRVLDEPSRLSIVSDTFGDIDFRLDELVGGSRGTSTSLSLSITMAIEPVFRRRAREQWQVALDQLAELVRGHPVRWRHDAVPDGADALGDTMRQN